jgi:hypothetical protein
LPDVADPVKVLKPGANSLGDTPLSHLAFQNGVFFPSPITITVEAKNRALSVYLENARHPSKGDHGCPN